MEKIVRLIAFRLFQGIFVAVGVATLTFVLLTVMPNDMAVNITIAQYGEDGLDKDRVEQVRRDSGLTSSPIKQYGRWLKRTLTFDLGRSIVTERPVWEVLGFHLGLSFKLASAAMLFSLVLALPLGMAAGFAPGSWIDILSSVFSSVMVSLPGFVLGAVLILLLAVRIHLLPAAGFSMPANLVLPAITLGTGLAAVSSRIIRTAVTDVKGASFLTFARIKGLPGIRVLLNHGLKNGAVPVITFFALQLAHVLDGVVVLENLFNWPGIGLLLLESIQGRDIPMIQGVTLVIGLLYVGANLIADLICAWLDPRQLSAGEGV